MSPAAEIQLIVFRELRRSVRSVKGIVLGVLTLIGAFVTSLVCVYLEGNRREEVGAATNEAFIEMKRAAIEKATGDSSFAAYAATIPSSLLIFLKVAIWLSPLLIALLGFDGMASDLQHRSVRFWTVRSRRWSFFAGKFIGLWALVGLITLVLNLLAGTVALVKGYVSVGQLFGWGLWFWVVAFLIGGTWAAIATFISSCFKTPILALLTTFGTFFVMWIFGLVGWITRVSDEMNTGVVKDMSWYEYIYPNAYDTLMIAQQTTRILEAAGILVGFILVVMAAGSFLFQRRDI